MQGMMPQGAGFAGMGPQMGSIGLAQVCFLCFLGSFIDLNCSVLLEKSLLGRRFSYEKANAEVHF